MNEEMNWELPFASIEAMLDQMQKSVDELKAQSALPETLNGTELELMCAILRLNDLRAEMTATQLRHEVLRHHWAKLRKAELEVVLAPPMPTTETAEVSGQGPIPPTPATENSVVDEKAPDPATERKEPA